MHERAPGPTMLEAMLTGGTHLADGAGILADLHRRLHELPAMVARAPSLVRSYLDEYLRAVGPDAPGDQLSSALERRSEDPGLADDERALFPLAARLVADQWTLVSTTRS
jgi:hypothetical protein